MQKLGKQAIKFDTPPVITEVASIVGGGGGGRPDMAQAGGKCSEKINLSIIGTQIKNILFI